MVDVLTAALQKGQTALAELGSAQDSTRFRLAAQAACVAAFDWQVGDGLITWDGATEILPFQRDVNRAAVFLDAIERDKRGALEAVIDSQSTQSTHFTVDIEIASAMGSVAFTMIGTRFPNATGRTERLVGMMRDTTERTREVQRLTYLATRDELTGHLNRNSLREELSLAIEAAKAENRHCAFLVSSIDRLAMINDGFGFDAGEEVIVAVGERLSRSLRGSDIIGRTAGNKFGVILKNCSEREVAIVAGRLRAAVRGSGIDTRGGQVSATCSVGAVWLPSAAATSQEAMLRAEKALERARATGRDGFVVYEHSAQRESARLRQMAVADEVVAALKDNRLRLAYQPIIQAKSRRISHYESLLRMQRKDGEIVTAGYFVPAAEQLGIVHLIDRFALETVIGRLKAHEKITLAVNVSGTASGDPAWLQDFVDYIRASQEVAQRLIVELTETAALHHFEENARFVTQLKDLGVRVSIDDFGAGYTSFRNLQMLHVDTVKIDGSYVKNLSESPENQVFVRTLVGLAKNFDIKTVAEWVGSDADAALLQSFGVDYFQGYHFGEPVIDPKFG
ncbi:MAG TPA: bifunctional diguanylate cyclase/phosphodiesterase [Rhizomicrobium sp.]|nr:bifunctional diguanylate cyclase/phosphodiesterase [Rhizomicrobium sp.]